ncbi:MAG: hypothetical protein Fur003_0920 [Candidatus Dojkabacteria bacterium]
MLGIESSIINDGRGGVIYSHKVVRRDPNVFDSKTRGCSYNVPKKRNQRSHKVPLPTRQAFYKPHLMAQGIEEALARDEPLDTLIADQFIEEMANLEKQGQPTTNQTILEFSTKRDISELLEKLCTRLVDAGNASGYDLRAYIVKRDADGRIQDKQAKLIKPAVVSSQTPKRLLIEIATTYSAENGYTHRITPRNLEDVRNLFN